MGYALISTAKANGLSSTMEGWLSLSMNVDEFRLYNRTLSPEEVEAGAWKLPSPDRPVPGLILRWGFDNPDSKVEVDLSGNGNHGVRGGVPGLYPETYAFTQVGTVQVQPPSPITSGALDLATGGGPCEGAAALARPGQHGVKLRLPHNATVSSLPEVGSLSLDPASGEQLVAGSVVASGAVFYSAPEDWSAASPVQFTYTASSASGEPVECTAMIHPGRPCQPADQIDESFPEGSWITRALRLAHFRCNDGRPVMAQVTSLPAIGSLWQPANFSMVPPGTTEFGLGQLVAAPDPVRLLPTRPPLCLVFLSRLFPPSHRIPAPALKVPPHNFFLFQSPPPTHPPAAPYPPPATATSPPNPAAEQHFPPSPYPRALHAAAAALHCAQRSPALCCPFTADFMRCSPVRTELSPLKLSSLFALRPLCQMPQSWP